MKPPPHKQQSNLVAIVDESTTIYEDQLLSVRELAKRTGLKKATIYRHALDYYLVSFRREIESVGLKIPRRLSAKTPQKLRKHTHPFTRKKIV